MNTSTAAVQVGGVGGEHSYEHLHRSCAGVHLWGGARS